MCQSLDLREWFLGVPIMWCVLGVLTWRSPSLSRLDHSRCLELGGSSWSQIPNRCSLSEESFRDGQWPTLGRYFAEWGCINTLPQVNSARQLKFFTGATSHEKQSTRSWSLPDIKGATFLQSPRGPQIKVIEARIKKNQTKQKITYNSISYKHGQNVLTIFDN